MYKSLSTSDFFISENKLSTYINGFSLVFFKTDTCRYCDDIFPAFESVAMSIKGCEFAIMDVNQDKMKIVKMSLNTTTKLEYVPFIVMYFNGSPVAIFKSNEDNPAENKNALKKFIINIAKEFSNVNSVKGEKGETLKSSKNQYIQKECKICETSTGIAICGPKNKKTCYLFLE